MMKTARENTGQRIMHPFGPLYDGNSRILILGSFPSVKSREQNFFYGHPQNRFWKVLAALFDRKVPQTIPEKKALILENGLALWDSIASQQPDRKDLLQRQEIIRDVREIHPAGTGKGGCVPAVHQPGERAVVHGTAG